MALWMLLPVDARMALRPARVAVVFDGGDDWHYWARLAIYAVCQVWGGAGFILIPHRDGGVSVLGVADKHRAGAAAISTHRGHLIGAQWQCNRSWPARPDRRRCPGLGEDPGRHPPGADGAVGDQA